MALSINWSLWSCTLSRAGFPDRDDLFGGKDCQRLRWSTGLDNGEEAGFPEQCLRPRVVLRSVGKIGLELGCIPDRGYSRAIIASRATTPQMMLRRFFLMMAKAFFTMSSQVRGAKREITGNRW